MSDLVHVYNNHGNDDNQAWINKGSFMTTGCIQSSFYFKLIIPGGRGRTVPIFLIESLVFVNILPIQ